MERNEDIIKMQADLIRLTEKICEIYYDQGYVDGVHMVTDKLKASAFGPKDDEETQ